MLPIIIIIIVIARSLVALVVHQNTYGPIGE